MTDIARTRSNNDSRRHHVKDQRSPPSEVPTIRERLSTLLPRHTCNPGRMTSLHHGDHETIVRGNRRATGDAVAGVQLTWDGKSAEVPRLHLPLQVVETVNAPRADRGTLFAGAAEQADGWHNKLIWGDNLHVLASLVDELAGQVDLIYIDPPFDSRQDYKVRISVGDDAADQDLSKLSSVIEEKAYRDTWGSGVDSYLQMLYLRLILLRELMSDKGSIYVHIAPNVSHLVRALLDEVFGGDDGYFRNEIIWKRSHGHNSANRFGTSHESLLFYSKTERVIWSQQYGDYDKSYVEKHYRHVDQNGRKYKHENPTGPGIRKGETGRPWRGVDPTAKGRHWSLPPAELEELDRQGQIYWPKKGGWPYIKLYLDERGGAPLQDVWTDIDPINMIAKERLGYDTQKPEALLERIIKSSSDEGSIVLDCFAGSGTTAAVAERLNRRWVAIDIGRFSVHTTRKRVLDIPQCKPFIVANLGRYERQVWQADTTGSHLQEYLDFIVKLYHASPNHEFQHIHGTLDKRAIHVGAVDAPVTLAEIKESLDEVTNSGFRGLDVLGWEFEMGLHELVQDEALARGMNLQLRRIPREIMDPRVVASEEVTFHELAYLKVETQVKKRELRIHLVEFVLSNPELISQSVREKISGWSDYVDYWAVDFTYGSNGEGDTFHNQWQSYRTRANRKLELVADHTYDEPGKHTVLVKVVDIFGNDTTTAVEVTVK